MEPYGYIYVIKNDINDLIYVGETSRDIYTRFDEHCYDTRSHSLIHKAITQYGVKHFKIEELERVPLSHIYEREAYWVKHFNSYHCGYNATPTGNPCSAIDNYSNVHIIEPNLYVDNAEFLGREISRLTSWSSRFSVDKIRNALQNHTDFLGYHLEYVDIDKEYLSSIDEYENWIKLLNIQFCGKHIYSPELDKEFESVGLAARYLLDNGYYVGTSVMPIQNIITVLSHHLKTQSELSCIKGDLHFEYSPGTTKNADNDFQKINIYCNELNMTFESQKDAANYMLENKLWTGIKLKTAILRISDVVNGVFPSYKGYTFIKN